MRLIIHHPEKQTNQQRWALGIITAAVVKLYPKPRSRETAMAGVSDPHKATAFLSLAQQMAGSDVKSFELMPRIALEFVTRHIEGSRNPFAAPSPWYVLMEATGGAHANLTASFED